jgi:hypothetical protein
MPTIDDMMLISDGHDPFHYINGQGFQNKEGKVSTHTNRQYFKNTYKDNILAGLEAEMAFNNNILNTLETENTLINGMHFYDVEDDEEEENAKIKDDLIKENALIKDIKKRLTSVDNTDENYSKVNEADKNIFNAVLELKNSTEPFQTTTSDEEMNKISHEFKENVQTPLDTIFEEGEEYIEPLKEFKSNDDFELKMSGIENVTNNTIIAKYSPLNKPKNKYILEAVKIGCPDIWSKLEKSPTTPKVMAFNTNFNVTNSKGELIWKADPNYWVDGLWTIKYTDSNGNEKEAKIAPEYKYYAKSYKSSLDTYQRKYNEGKITKEELEEKSNKYRNTPEYYNKLPYNYKELLSTNEDILRKYRLTLTKELKDIYYDMQGNDNKKKVKKLEKEYDELYDVINNPKKLKEDFSKKYLSSRHGLNMSISKTGIHPNKISKTEENKILSDMLKTVHKIPEFDSKGKIAQVVNQKGIPISSKGFDSSTPFIGAELLFIIGNTDSLIVNNYSKDIKRGNVSLTEPLSKTKASKSSYGKEIKSISLNPLNFKPMKKIK